MLPVIKEVVYDLEPSSNSSFGRVMLLTHCPEFQTADPFELPPCLSRYVAVQSIKTATSLRLGSLGYLPTYYLIRKNTVRSIRRFYSL
jgi:hypothetical protein